MAIQIVKTFFIFLCVLFVMMIFFGIGVVYLNSPPGTKSYNNTFIIKKGESLINISNNLESKGIIRSAIFLRIVSKLLETEKDFRAGYYKMEKGFSTFDVHNLLISGKQTQIRITIPEGWTKTKIARHFEDYGIYRTEEILKAIQSENLMKKYGIRANNLEGYLFPDTYFINESLAAEEIIERMVKNFFINLKEIVPDYESMSRKQIHNNVIMASIIEKEYRISEEAPIISSVFYNRLKTQIGLESCATIEYIITEIYGEPHPETITAEMKAIDSPYNTYMWYGLPPGPVTNPGRIALAASFRPAQTDYWYFCVKNSETGEHYFSRTLEEHNQAKWYYLKGRGLPPKEND
ncbi:MAG: endolytic transglycosylase MltG [Spirochaetales bacterium]|nr:endolytic transglycosylase MltG [Spirochaetales bacterium]